MENMGSGTKMGRYRPYAEPENPASTFNAPQDAVQNCDRGRGLGCGRGRGGWRGRGEVQDRSGAITVRVEPVLRS